MSLQSGVMLRQRRYLETLSMITEGDIRSLRKDGCIIPARSIVSYAGILRGSS